MHKVASADKKLLNLINATVSHEMRNPTNSIYCQNIIQNQLNEKLQDLINDTKPISVSRIKKKLRSICNQHTESVKIQMSSTKLLKFLVNDILDFSQLRAGKFRKDCGNFNLKESIEEIIMIQQYKAEQTGVQVELDL